MKSFNGTDAASGTSGRHVHIIRHFALENETAGNDPGRSMTGWGESSAV